MTSPQMRPARPRDPRPTPATLGHVQERRDIERQIRVIAQNSGPHDVRLDPLFDRLKQLTPSARQHDQEER